MRTKFLKLTIDLQYPNIYTYYKIKSFMKLFDEKFVKYNMIIKDEFPESSKITINDKISENETEFNGSENIIKHIDNKMNKFYDNSHVKSSTYTYNIINDFKNI
jgi:hypothetical protein